MSAGETYGIVVECFCGSDGGEGCCCCKDWCPEDCMADHRGEQ